MNIPTFPLFVVLGFSVMLALIFKALKALPDTIDEENFILPKIVVCGLTGYFFSAAFDSLVKINLYHQFKFTGISFYGGLIGSTVSLFLLLMLSKNKTRLSIKMWLDLLTVPFIIFHFFGRLGCFFGGCCYGKATDSFLGVNFPDNIEHGIYHMGAKCYPTQLFEAFALLIIILIIVKTKDRFVNYIFLYSIARFIIEFFRGDVRGSISKIFSPSQVVSILLFCITASYKLIKIIRYVRYHKSS